MAIRKIGIGKLSLSLLANDYEVAFNISLGGKLWKTFFQYLKKNIQSKTEVSSVQTGGLPPDLRVQQSDTPELIALRKQVEETNWYHTHDFGSGIITRGYYDHAPILKEYKLPETLTGKRVLDVATFDGYWAFEFERRGAKEVYALDLDRKVELDFPPKMRAQMTTEELSTKFGSGFHLAHEQFQSNVKRVTCNVYDLSPDMFGIFDIVHIGDVLLHLNSPIKALQNVCNVCNEYALISECYFPDLEHFSSRNILEYEGGYSECIWWKISLSALRQMILDAGFRSVEMISKFKYGPRGKPKTMDHVVFKAIK